jgi:hypothetical protein
MLPATREQVLVCLRTLDPGTLLVADEDDLPFPGEGGTVGYTTMATVLQEAAEADPTASTTAPPDTYTYKVVVTTTRHAESAVTHALAHAVEGLGEDLAGAIVRLYPWQ